MEWVAISCSGDLPNLGIESTSPASPALTGGFFTNKATWEAPQKSPLIKLLSDSAFTM